MCRESRVDRVLDVVWAVRDGLQIISEASRIGRGRGGGEKPGAGEKGEDHHAKRTPLGNAVAASVRRTAPQAERVVHEE